MNDRTTQADTTAQPAREPKERPQPGEPLMKISDVPTEVRAYAASKLAPKDADGNRAKISVARENGSYYGPVVLNNDKFIVQAVGKDRSSAVVHPKDNVALQGDILPSLDVKKQMNNFVVQIHYSGDRAKAYPFRHKEATTDQEQHGKASKGEHGLKPEALLAQAKEYAAGMKNAGQRGAFMKHMEAVVAQATHTPEKSAHVTAPAQASQKQQPEKSAHQPAPKPADKGVER